MGGFVLLSIFDEAVEIISLMIIISLKFFLNFFKLFLVFFKFFDLRLSKLFKNSTSIGEALAFFSSVFFSPSFDSDFSSPKPTSEDFALIVSRVDFGIRFFDRLRKISGNIVIFRILQRSGSDFLGTIQLIIIFIKITRRKALITPKNRPRILSIELSLLERILLTICPVTKIQIIIKMMRIIEGRNTV